MKQLLQRVAQQVQPLGQRIPKVADMLMQWSHYFPHRDRTATYQLPAYAGKGTADPASPLLVPPKEFWAYYSTSPETFLRSGLDDITTMRRVLGESGTPIDGVGRILELGVAGGRLMRHLQDLAPTQEIWGVDIWADAIMWLRDNLCPPFNVAVTSIEPHLPFADGYFGLVYAGSVFTHIDDRVDSWFCELHRVIKPGGSLYFSINDRHACQYFRETNLKTPKMQRFVERCAGEQAWLEWCARVASNPHAQAVIEGRADMATMGRSWRANVLWDRDALLKRIGPRWELKAWTPEGYGHQSTLLLQRRH